MQNIIQMKANDAAKLQNAQSGGTTESIRRTHATAKPGPLASAAFSRQLRLRFNPEPLYPACREEAAFPMCQGVAL